MPQPLYMDDVDEQRVAALYQRHAPGLFTYLRLHLRSREDAEDVLAEVFLRSFENASFHQLSEPQQQVWLWRVARNKLADHYRVAARRQTVDLDTLAEEIYDDEELSPERLAERDEEYLRLSEALGELSPVQQQVLRLRLVNGLRCVDIAKQLGKSEGAMHGRPTAYILPPAKASPPHRMISSARLAPFASGLLAPDLSSSRAGCRTLAGSGMPTTY